MHGRRAATAALLVGLALTSLGAAHYYLARRLVLDPAWDEPFRTAALAAIGILGLGSILQPALERALPAPWFRLLSWPFLLWMGFFWIGFNTLWIGDALRGGAHLLGLGAIAPESYALLLATSIACLAAAGLVGGLRFPSVKRVEHRLARWPLALDGLRLVQISDIHIGPILGRRFAERLVERVNGLDADLVAITGDLVDGRVAQLREDVAPFGDLAARYGVFFVTGNHDVYSGDEAWVARLRELGIRPLRNARVRVGEEGREGFWLAGVDDHRGDLARGSSEDLPAALEGWDATSPLVLLAHDPSTFKRSHRRGIDLQLSGHTHGGQIWPFRWMVRMVIPWVAGAYEIAGSRLYVSRGTGFWGPPMRLLAPAEITEHVLRAA